MLLIFKGLKNFRAVSGVKVNYFSFFARFRLRIPATRQ